MAGKADLVNSIADFGFDPQAPDDAWDYAALDAAEAAGADPQRGGGWVADG